MWTGMCTKHGTHFATRVLVIDKGSPTVPGSILTGTVATSQALAVSA